MIQKPKIQYVGQFYVHGSEAQVLERKKERRRAKTKLPMARLERIEKNYVDPVALAGILVAFVMLFTMVAGVLQLQDDWAEYTQMSAYVSELKKENAELTKTYRDGYDLEEIRKRALALGLVPVEDTDTMTIHVTVPTPEPEPTLWENIVWFWEGLFA